MKNNKTKVEEFKTFRAKLNEKLLSQNNTVINRLFSLDTITYHKGILDCKTKEMLGLCASIVLRCDDCIKYHLEKCFENEVTKEELFEVFGISSVVGGTITIPHLRKALDYWSELEEKSFV